MKHTKVKNKSLYICKEGKVYYAYLYKDKSLIKEIPFGSYASALSFADKFELETNGEI